MSAHLRAVPPARVQHPSRPGLSYALLLILVGALSGLIVGWLATVFFRG